MIKTVIFDLDRTLYDYDYAHKTAFKKVSEYVWENLSISPQDFSWLYDKASAEIEAEMGQVSACRNRILRFQRILEENAYPLSPHALKMYNIYWDTFIEAEKAYDDAHLTLTRIKEHGCRIGLGSDMPAVIQFRKLEDMKLLRFFDFVVTSEEAGCEKPQAPFWELCLKKAGCHPYECLFVGDNLKKDVMGPISCGMNAVWFNPMPMPDEDGVRRIRRLSEILKLL